MSMFPKLGQLGVWKKTAIAAGVQYAAAAFVLYKRKCFKKHFRTGPELLFFVHKNVTASIIYPINL